MTIRKNRFALLAGILAGMTSPTTIYAQPSYPRLVGSDLERLRKDVSRVGMDFSTVIDSEYAKKSSSNGSK